jgi:CDP-diacylglycerol--glycerol-3-phosphate 3-phosphatidyltransferase
MARIFTSFKSGVRAAFDPPGRTLVRMGVSPDAVTLAGTAGVVVAAALLVTTGHLVVGTIIITLCALLDVLDGAMARARGYTTRFGGVLDSTMDRVADGAVFGALAWWLATTGQRTLAAVALVCLVSGQVVPYVKARAEAAGLRCDVGVAERMERLVLVGVGGLLTGFGAGWGLAAALWLLAVLSVVTAVQRIVHVRGQDASRPSAPVAPR